jgi:hypothetical protein
MRLHKTVIWSIQAHEVRKDLHRCGDMDASEFRWHWTAGGAAAYKVASIRHDVTNIIEQMELWLRTRVRMQLSSDHREGWWSAIPKDIRHRAERRHLVASEEFGKRRAGPAHSADWLSFGDLLKLVVGLSPESWRHCLDATVDRTPQVHRTFAGIKSFRDSRVAHLQSGGPTPAEIKRLLNLTDSLCELLRPQDYILSGSFRKLLSGIVGDQRRQLMEIYSEFRRPKAALGLRLKALDRVLSRSEVGSTREAELSYCDAIIREAGETAGKMGTLFGDA